MNPNIQKKIIKSKETFLEFEKKGFSHEGFCLVPFTSMIFSPGGEIGVCRHKGSEFTISNFDSLKFESIWNSEFLQKWRKEFITGNAMTCKKEIEDQSCNLCPYNNELLPDLQLAEIQSNPPLKLSLNLNGKCNLQCQMCHIWKDPNHFYDQTDFWSFAEKNLFPVAKGIDLHSGEPFIQKDTYKLIDIISQINSDCQWSITTNAHWKLNAYIKSKLDTINIKNLIVSIDSFIPEIYAKIRYPGKLSTVLENLERLIKYDQRRIEKGQSSLSIHLNFLVQKDNWKEIPYAINFCIEKGIIPFITYLYEPTEFSLNTLNEKAKIEILDYIIFTSPSHLIPFSMRIIRPLIKTLPTVIRKKYLFTLKDSLKGSL
jgi:cyclic pyranopterin phosphate synthase